jgi:hypothetical protein
MKILVWGIEPDLQTVDLKAKYLLDTANIFNIKIEILGVGHTFTNFRDRLYILQDYLKLANPDDIILIMDGYDTLFNDKLEVALEKFLSKNTRILISAEQIFTYQYPMFLEKYEQIKSPYKFVNAGTYMGYAGDILKMLNELFELPYDGIDQGLIGVWLYNNLDNYKLVQLDTNCDVFWITSNDWHILKEVANQKNTIINPLTNTRPFIIHNTGNSDNTIYQSYESAYKTIINY